MDLTGAIDLHVHTGPDVVERKQDDHEMVADAQAAGMAAVLIKSHVTLTADRASLAGRGGKIRVFGGVVLNQHVGGLNPVAAETAIELGAKQIWMPTLHAQNCMDKAEVEMFRREVERGRQGISILDESGGVIDRVLTILEIVRDADAILGTGHIAPEESLALLVAAKDIGLTRLLVTHPLMHFTYFDRDQMRAGPLNWAPNSSSTTCPAAPRGIARCRQQFLQQRFATWALPIVSAPATADNTSTKSPRTCCGPSPRSYDETGSKRTNCV